MGPEKLGRLIDSHAAALVLYARQWCASPEDVVQESFVKLAGRSTPPDPVLPWLYRVVRNAAISARRAETRRRHHESIAAARQPAWFLPSEGTALDGATVTAALQWLPLEQREVLVARLWGGLTFEQISELTGSSSSSMHRLYHAGLAALRERLRIPCPSSPSNPN
jgi:RNA polymerase sigma-70 factor (ECF subfamily)